jgi:hypothetical protein
MVWCVSTAGFRAGVERVLGVGFGGCGTLLGPEGTGRCCGCFVSGWPFHRLLWSVLGCVWGVGLGLVVA